MDVTVADICVWNNVVYRIWVKDEKNWQTNKSVIWEQKEACRNDMADGCIQPC